jgi:hypothetical protein
MTDSGKSIDGVAKAKSGNKSGKQAAKEAAEKRRLQQGGGAGAHDPDDELVRTVQTMATAVKR